MGGRLGHTATAYAGNAEGGGIKKYWIANMNEIINFLLWSINIDYLLG